MTIRWNKKAGCSCLKRMILLSLLLSAAGLPVSAAEREPVVIDNDDKAQVIISGAWTASSNNRGYQGANYLQDGNAGKGKKSVTFRPSNDISGNWTVYVSFPAFVNRAGNVPVLVTYGKNKTKKLLVDQRKKDGDGIWLMLEAFEFEGGCAEVEISNADTDGYVVVDAVKFTKTDLNPLRGDTIAQAAPEAADDNNIRISKGLYSSLLYVPGNSNKPGKRSWQEEQAKVLPQGDLQWAPHDFIFTAGSSVRYIDFEQGNDNNTGTSRESAWKHHPWDVSAAGSAKICCGIHTYVFKGGVYYRGELTIKESGTRNNIIRLTRDPSWGNGDAVLCGSEVVHGWKKGAGRQDIPDQENVWHIDLEYAPRSIWMIAADEKILRIPLARMPNWKITDPVDYKSGWFSFDGPAGWNKSIAEIDGKKMHICSDAENVRGKPADLFENALIWYEQCQVAAVPYATKVQYVNTDSGKLGFHGWHYSDRSASGIIMKGCRYYLEDKPQYLDDPDGEFWFDKRESGGRLYIRLPGNSDPNTVRIEAAKRRNMISGIDARHIEITGLCFRFNNTVWDITDNHLNLSVTPALMRPDIHPGCIQIWGSGIDIRIANCLFENIYLPIHLQAGEAGTLIDQIVIEDNHIRHTDFGGLTVKAGNALYGHVMPRGLLGDVRILRNRFVNTGFRPLRYNKGSGTINIAQAATVEIAGNIIERCSQQGINVIGSKGDHHWGEVPLARYLIHHNKVWDSLLDSSDYGGIETWQGGPFYVFNNIVHNAQGMWRWQLIQQGKTTGFGHAYYLDGGFKNYHFNNIAWGKSSDPANPLVNCSAFQEIISYQNTFFNNTTYNFCTGSRRQNPQAGRNKYLGNIWMGISEQVFRHGEPVKITGDAGNAADVAKSSSGLLKYALETDAYTRNIFYQTAKIGVAEPLYNAEGWSPPESALLMLEDFKAALISNHALAADTGVESKSIPLRDPGHGDFRPVPGAAPGSGAKVFVPWALYGVAAEWNFYHAGNDPAEIIDEHWYMTEYHTDRAKFLIRPRYPLRAVNIGVGDYVPGPLEDWINGALRFISAKKQYAVLSNAAMMRPFTFEADTVSVFEGRKKRSFTFEGEALKNPQIHQGNLLIEAYFKTAAGHTGGTIIEKMRDSGYRLAVDNGGSAEFMISAAGSGTSVKSAVKINDGNWHHVIAELDRQAKTLTIYIDGKTDARAAGPDNTQSLANDGDLYAGGTPAGAYLDGAIDFIRVARGTLAEAKTTIEELYAWEFDGPFLRDLTGKKTPVGGRRAAGAVAE